MSPEIRMRPSMLPTVAPMIAEVLLEGLFDEGVKVSDGEITGEIEEDVNISLFPTVDSGRRTACIALAGSNLSVVTTSMYAHAGTAVAGLILLGYLYFCRQFLPKGQRKKQRATHLDTETIELVQSLRHEDHLMVPNEHEAREGRKIYQRCVDLIRERLVEHTLLSSPLGLLVCPFGKPSTQP